MVRAIRKQPAHRGNGFVRGLERAAARRMVMLWPSVPEGRREMLT